jgi:hypothetical protein
LYPCMSISEAAKDKHGRLQNPDEPTIRSKQSWSVNHGSQA